MPRRRTTAKAPSGRTSNEDVDRLRKALDITDEALRKIRDAKIKKKGAARSKPH